jgi:branched-chain amino acid transport system permease protein
MEVFLQQVLNGLVLGSGYALMALGLTIIFGILEVVNFAHGEVYMIGAFVTLFISTQIGIPFLPSIIIAMSVVAILGVLIEKAVFRPILGKPMINGMLLSFGLSTFLMNIALFLFKADPRRLESGYSHIQLNLWGLLITMERLLVIIVAGVLVTLLWIFIQRTKTGRAMRAVAQDREAAQLSGVSISKVYPLTFAIGCALATAAGSLMGAIFNISPNMGWSMVIKSFVVVIMGGFGSVTGAILAGLVLGLAESLGGGYISYAYKDVYVFALLMLIFLFRPEGLTSGVK